MQLSIHWNKNNIIPILLEKSNIKKIHQNYTELTRIAKKGTQE